MTANVIAVPSRAETTPPPETCHAPLDEDEMRLWTAFLEAATVALERLDRALHEFDLTLPDYEVLVFLSAEDDQRLTMKELAARTLQAKSRLTYRVDRLEKAGMVTREACHEDARRVWCTLTPAGLRLLETAWPSHLASVRRFVVDPVGRRDLPAATRALERIVAELRG